MSKVKLSPTQIQKLVEKVFQAWEDQDQVKFKSPRSEAIQRAVIAIQDNLEQEFQIEEQARKMVDQLEKKGESFDRHKMFILIKNQLAKEKSFVL
jgi:hypothetical protein